MWKKALWIYLGLYCLGVLYALGATIVRDAQAGAAFNLSGAVFVLIMFISPLAVALGLKGKKVHILLALFCVLINAAPVVGILNFNEMSLETIGKALLFVPMIIALLYYGIKGLSKKKGELSLEKPE
jgi:hypothetical protein